MSGWLETQEVSWRSAELTKRRLSQACRCDSVPAPGCTVSAQGGQPALRHPNEPPGLRASV